MLVQGFGAVGAHATRLLRTRLPDAKVIGVSDIDGCLFDPSGLPADKLFAFWREQGAGHARLVRGLPAAKRPPAPDALLHGPDQLLRESAFALVPAAPVFNYLGVRPSEPCSVSMSAWAPGR